MSVLGLVLLLCALAVGAYFVNTSAVINTTFKRIINFVLVVAAILLVLVAFGVWDEVKDVKVPKL